MHIYIYIYVCMYACMYVCMYVCMCIYRYRYVKSDMVPSLKVSVGGSGKYL
jgi:hypothetical protein